MAHPERTRVELAQERLPVDLRTPIDPRDLRLRFRDLCDRAAAHFLRLGYDFDDVELQRSLICRTNTGDEFEVCDPPFSDADRLSEAISRQRAMRTDGDDVGTEVRIIELRVVVWRECAPP